MGKDSRPFSWGVQAEFLVSGVLQTSLGQSIKPHLEDVRGLTLFSLSQWVMGKRKCNSGRENVFNSKLPCEVVVTFIIVLLNSVTFIMSPWVHKSGLELAPSRGAPLPSDFTVLSFIFPRILAWPLDVASVCVCHHVPEICQRFFIYIYTVAHLWAKVQNHEKPKHHQTKPLPPPKKEKGGSNMSIR